MNWAPGPECVAAIFGSYDKFEKKIKGAFGDPDEERTAELKSLIFGQAPAEASAPALDSSSQEDKASPGLSWGVFRDGSV
jgi:hypothetical protein